MKIYNFDSKININDDIYTTYKNKELILKHVFYYDGPITLQYLPNGGIQSTFNYNLIINSKYGFIACKYVIYDNKKLTLFDFINSNKDLVNTILPN